MVKKKTTVLVTAYGLGGRTDDCLSQRSFSVMVGGMFRYVTYSERIKEVLESYQMMNDDQMYRPYIFWHYQRHRLWLCLLKIQSCHVAIPLTDYVSTKTLNKFLWSGGSNSWELLHFTVRTLPANCATLISCRRFLLKHAKRTFLWEGFNPSMKWGRDRSLSKIIKLDGIVREANRNYWRERKMVCQHGEGLSVK